MSSFSQKLAARAATAHTAPMKELSVDGRVQVVEMMNRLLAEIVDVALCARHAHWNARGRSFLLVHDLLDRVGGQLDAQADLTAKRIRALGGTAHGTAQTVATVSSFKPYPVEVADGQDHLVALGMRLGLLSAEARLSVYECSGLLDTVTANTIAKVNAAIDEALLLVEGHLVERK